MVLQQGQPVPVWGWADDGESVTVQFRDQKVSTTARDGKWQVRLRKLQAGGPDPLMVSGRNQISDFREWVRLDLQYIDNWSLWLDFKIILRTIPVVLMGRGAK